MRTWRLIVLLLAVSAVGHAAAPVVTANADLTFSPTPVTIVLGDAVVFKNGSGLHNVHADDNRFWCSVNCTTNRMPNASLWEVTIQFSHLGTFGYFCDQHGNISTGMRGAVIVVPDIIFADAFEAPTGAAKAGTALERVR